MVQKKMKQRNMNKDILNVACIFLGLYLILTIYFLWLSGYESQQYVNNSYNKLLYLLEDTVVRGDIYSADGEILATASYNEDGDSQRYYPYKNQYCHVVGSLTKGRTGIEAAYNYQLLSSDDSIMKKITNDLKNKKDQGNSIVTTLDTTVQSAAYQAMEGYEGAVIVMDNKTGNILAMVSAPDYDPNFSYVDENSSVLLNRATQGLYTPGSIFKLLTLQEYLRQGNSADYSYECTGSIEVDGHKIHCSNRSAHGKVNLEESFAYSCNCSFINMGLQLDMGDFQKNCEQLLFNHPIPFALDSKVSYISLAENKTDFMKAQLLFGQGDTLMTPVHAAMLMQGIANDGICKEPRIVSSIKGSRGEVRIIDSGKDILLFTEDECRMLKPYLRSVVDYGTARALNSFEHFTVYGKTGTAEIDSLGNANSWFSGFAESTDKEQSYTIVVVVENIDSDTSPAPAVSVTKEILKVLD